MCIAVLLLCSTPYKVSTTCGSWQSNTQRVVYTLSPLSIRAARCWWFSGWLFKICLRS